MGDGAERGRQDRGAAELFPNNVLHLFTASAWIACCFLHNRRMSLARVLDWAATYYPFLQAGAVHAVGARTNSASAWPRTRRPVRALRPP
jgi:glycerol-3-phosphate O-acyltransferase